MSILRLYSDDGRVAEAKSCDATWSKFLNPNGELKSIWDDYDKEIDKIKVKFYIRKTKPNPSKDRYYYFELENKNDTITPFKEHWYKVKENEITNFNNFSKNPR